MHNRSYSRYVLTVLCISVVGTALVLVGLNAWMNQRGVGPKRTFLNLPLTDSEIKTAYAEGYNAARSRFIGGAYSSFDPQSVSFSGLTLKVEKDSLVVKQTTMDTNPQVDEVDDEREVILKKGAKVYKEGVKSPEQLEKELDTYQKTLRSNPNALPPSPVEKIEIKLIDIPKNAKVRITSDSLVRLAEKITAVEVALIQ